MNVRTIPLYHCGLIAVPNGLVTEGDIESNGRGYIGGKYVYVGRWEVWERERAVWRVSFTWAAGAALLPGGLRACIVEGISRLGDYKR